MKAPAKFRKKPVVVEAIQWTGTNRVEVARFIHGDNLDLLYNLLLPGHLIMIQTLEGAMSAPPGDWIIRGVAGEFYPCKPDIFTATYEAVNE